MIPRSRGRLYATGLVAAGVLGGVVLAGLNVASAQPSPTPTPRTVKPHEPGAKPFGHGLKHGGPLRGLGHALHGEFTTPALGGGYQVLATQAGEVTAVSATSLTVKSEDGYSRTYVVGDGTLVNAGDDGIADVKTGDRVRVLAVVKDGTATAVNVVDGTSVKQLRERWAPKRFRRGAPGAPGTSTTSGAA